MEMLNRLVLLGLWVLSFISVVMNVRAIYRLLKLKIYGKGFEIDDSVIFYIGINIMLNLSYIGYILYIIK